MNDAEKYGRIVREAWIKYCIETGRTERPDRIALWEQLDEWSKEVDRRIGMACYAAATADTERLVRQAVEATMVAAASLQTSGATYWTSELAAVLRNNIDIAAIVRRVMQEDKPQ